jgi:xanthine dehydrogenase accessory factor
MTESNFNPNRVIVRGAGEMASGVIRRLSVAGFDVIALEKPNPACIRRYVCFAEAFYKKEILVDGVTAILVNSVEEALAVSGKRHVPLLIDSKAEFVSEFMPVAVIDGCMLKRKGDTNLDMAPVVIGLGPGFTVGENCHAAVETKRGIDLGRVMHSGSPREDTRIPEAVNGYSHQRLLRAPTDGEFISHCKITDIVKSGQILGEVDGVSVIAEMDGMVRGMIHNGLKVTTGQKIGDIDPRCVRDHCFKISDRANAVGGGALEALMALKAGIMK